MIELLADGRLVVAYLANGANIRDHYGFGDWTVVTSGDGGATWSPAAPDDMSIPFNWPGTSPRERYDRFAGRMPDGTLVAAGGVGFEEAPADRVDEAKAAGRLIAVHPLRDDSTVLLGGNRVFVQRSHDGGRTWERQEWEVPGAHRLNGFPRCTVLADGTILAPLYDEGRHRGRPRAGAGISFDGQRGELAAPAGGQRSERGLWRRIGAGGNGTGARALPDPQSAAAVGRGVVGRWRPHLVGGDLPDIWGYPPHLLKLRDGRILCSYGHRRDPLGVQAVISADGGRSWDLDHRAILRGDGETMDLAIRSRCSCRTTASLRCTT